MSGAITRHFATLGRRQVHYRRAGQGAPVLLLHPSPESSAGFIPLIQRLAGNFTVIAPDTPGNGLSAPLDETWPEMTAFAGNIVALLDALGIARAAIYGFHTGALCALELARRHPDRVALCVANGYLQMPEDLQRDIVENYFVPLAPIDWSGGHLTWLWSRMREQWNFFPWYKKSLACRGASDPPDAAGLHRAVHNMLAAGDGYRGAYRAAFTFDAPQAVQEIAAPTLITCPRNDILFPSLQAMPTPAACVRVEAADDLAGCEDLLERDLAALPDLPAPPVTPTAAIDGQLWSDMIQVDGLSLHARRSISGAGRAIVFVHDLTGSSRCWNRHMRAFLGARPVIGIDLAGRGESDPWPDGITPTIEAQAAMLNRALDAIGYRAVDLIADRDGGAIATALAARRSDGVAHLLLLELPGADESRIAPSLEPDLAGGHLLTAWQAVRDRELFSPWFDRRHEAAIAWREPDLDPDQVHRRTLALIACADMLPALEAAGAARPSLDRLHVPILLGCPNSPATRAVAARPNIRMAALTPLDPARFAAEALAFFDD